MLSLKNSWSKNEQKCDILRKRNNIMTNEIVEKTVS